jgi:hypothetical protein
MRDEENEQSIRVDAANKAAPYIHAKLATVDHKSSDGTMSPPTRVIVEGVDGSAG